MNLISPPNPPTGSDRFKYANLSLSDAEALCVRVASDPALTLQEKWNQLNLIAYGQTYDRIGASYRLISPGKVTVWAKSYNILKARIVLPCTLFTPEMGSELPQVAISFDCGRIADFIDGGDD